MTQPMMMLLLALCSSGPGSVQRPCAAAIVGREPKTEKEVLIYYRLHESCWISDRDGYINPVKYGDCMNKKKSTDAKIVGEK